ncbi:MAG: hypothetical protein WCG47_09765, partial [Dermatophilaceae bacterium]
MAGQPADLALADARRMLEARFPGEADTSTGLVSDRTDDHLLGQWDVLQLGDLRGGEPSLLHGAGGRLCAQRCGQDTVDACVRALHVDPRVRAGPA